ncbi:hypothetical protein SAMD00020551_0557 [Mesobacillus selenatarsenatis SF-1]|uniref:Uncharacterized protein n=1 Tax=Mesobacillus selenatarsenatis (strain DSM 18680 / JCM 14380 / FERM P-15431 / SF-1) TaxID=1321606 RepID=A0A0A8WXT6_MESS1|nr:hypothetical protein SAMD00020551_0557 [Mesobacillus selenatarsenatis SF-1]
MNILHSLVKAIITFVIKARFFMILINRRLESLVRMPSLT